MADFLFRISDCFGLVYYIVEGRVWVQEVDAEFGVVASGIQNSELYYQGVESVVDFGLCILVDFDGWMLEVCS